MSKAYLKSNRVFTPLRRMAWLFVFLVALGGLWYPKLGLLMIPVMITLAIMGYKKGKYWCGNICPHGSLFDYIYLPLSRNARIPDWMKTRTAALIAFAYFMYMLGGRIIKTAAFWGQVSFWDKLGYAFVFNYFIVTVVGTALAVIFTPRAWCTFCPMGTMQNAFYRIGRLLGSNKKSDVKVTILDYDQCKSCGKCARVCPMQLKPHENFNDQGQFDDDECIRCGTCIENCPGKLLTIKPVSLPAAEKIPSSIAS